MIPSRASKARGLTVVELVISMALLTIVMLIAYPNFQRLSINGNLRTAARDLVADFSALRNRAIAENTTFDLTFSGCTYTCPGLPNGAKSPAEVAGDISIASAPATAITFFSRGTLSQPGSVVLTNSRGSTATVSFSLSGRTYVQFYMQ